MAGGPGYQVRDLPSGGGGAETDPGTKGAFLFCLSLNQLAFRGPKFQTGDGVLSTQAKIDRAQRWVRMLEEEARLLANRVRELTPEHQKSAQDYAARLTEHARAHLEELIEERALRESIEATPHAAD